MADLQSTEIRMALVWDCDNCGRENVERLVHQMSTPEEQEDAAMMFDQPEVRPFSLAPLPLLVVCKHCHQQFRVSRNALIPGIDDE